MFIKWVSYYFYFESRSHKSVKSHVRPKNPTPMATMMKSDIIVSPFIKDDYGIFQITNQDPDK